MGHVKNNKPEMRTIVFVDAVNFTNELKTHGRATIAPKIAQLQEFTEFFFVHKLRAEFIGKMGDGFLLLGPPTPPDVINAALSCQGFVVAYNVGKEGPQRLNTRIAIHYGLIAPPENGNYVDTNLNLTARLEGATPPNCVCISATLHDIVSDTLRDLTFRALKADFKGLGENRYYVVGDAAGRGSEPTRRESRLSFYFSTLSSLRDSEDWEAVRTTCEQALLDFPGNPEFTSQLGYSLTLLEDYPGAIRAYEQCVAKNYEVADSLLFMGRSYNWMGNQARAIDVLSEAVDKDPEPFHALADLADIYFDRCDYDEATKWAKRSLKVNRRFLFPIATLAAISVIKGDDDATVRLIRKVDVGRREGLRESVEFHLKTKGRKSYMKRLSAAFIAAGKKAGENQ